MQKKLLITVFLAAVFVLCIVKIGDGDIWYHLAAGKYILENKIIPHVDPFSYTAKGQPWVDAQWLFQILVYLLNSAFGINSLILLVATVIVLSAAFLLLTTKTNKSNFYAAIAVLFLGLLAARVRFVPRPHIFSYLFISIFSYIIARYRYQGDKKTLFLLPLIQLIWSNIHSGSIVGPIILGAYNLFKSKIASACPPVAGEPRNDGETRTLQLCLMLTTVAAFINPFTYKSVFYGVFTLNDPIFKKYIIEFRQATPEAFLSPYGALFLIGAASFLWARREKVWEPADLALFVVFGAASIWTVRMQSEFAYVAAPIVARNLSLGVIASPAKQGVAIPLRGGFALSKKGLLRHSCFGRLWQASQSFLAMTVAIVIILATFFTVTERGKWAEFGFGVNEYALPVRAAEFVKKNNLQGRMFNQMWFGGYLIWRLYPERQVFIDGRTDVYGPQLLYRETMFSEPRIWDALDMEFDFDYAIIWNMGIVKKYQTWHLDSLKDWRLVYWDDTSLVYVKANGKNNSVIDKYAYKYVLPGDLDLSYLDTRLGDKKAGESLISELKRNILDNPNCLLAHTSLGHVYARLDDYENAVSEFQEAIRITPYQHELYTRLGLIHQKAMKHDEAEAAYKKAIRLNSNDAEAHNNLGVVLYIKHDIKGAIRHWEKALQLNPTNEGTRLNLKTVREW